MVERSDKLQQLYLYKNYSCNANLLICDRIKEFKIAYAKRAYMESNSMKRKANCSNLHCYDFQKTFCRRPYIGCLKLAEFSLRFQ